MQLFPQTPTTSHWVICRIWAKKKKKKERERDSEICLSQASTSVEGRKEVSEISVVTESWSDKTENMRESQMRSWVERGKKAKPELLKSRIEIQNLTASEDKKLEYRTC